MIRKFPPRYWDSVCFLKFLNNEDTKGEATRCQNVLQYARAGMLRLYTSSITLTEVARIKGENPLSAEGRDRIERLFDADFIVIQEADIFTCHEARALMQSVSQLKPMDAIHVATALRIQRFIDADLKQIDTFDDAIAKCTSALRSMSIGQPDLPPFQDQQTFFDSDDEPEILDIIESPDE